jgi:hypothetical protein
MEIREVKIGELGAFTGSETFRRLHPKPITELRAISQANNPGAVPEQTALIYVARDHEVLGFTGLLPWKINPSGIPVFANSCWWVNPEKGRGLAIPLLMKAIEKSNSALFLTETTPKMKTLLEKTGCFEFSQPIEGIRGFFRFYLADWAQKRNPTLHSAILLLKIADAGLNLITSPYRKWFKSSLKNKILNIEKVRKITAPLKTFMEKYGESDFIAKTPEHFEWFQKYPWINESRQKEPYAYPFSHYVNKHELTYFVFRKNKEIKAFAAISYRDNLATIPYLYWDKRYAREAICSLWFILLSNQYDSLVVYHPGIVSYLKKHRAAFLYRKKVIKFTGTTKKVAPWMKEKPVIQDGDGDVIFT